MAASFAGSSDKLEWGASSFVPTAGCVAFLFRTTQVTTNVCIFSHFAGTASTGGVLVLLNNVANKISAHAKYDATHAAFLIPSSADVNDGNWHHFALNWSAAPGGSTELYIDGVLDGSATNAGAVSMSTSGTPVLGRSPDSFWPNYVGEIAEFFESVGDKLDPHMIAALAAGVTPDIATRKQTSSLYAALVRSDLNLFNQTHQTPVGVTYTRHPRTFR